MLPYAIFMIEIKWCDGTTLECRGLEPVTDGVTLRVTKEREHDFSKSAVKISCSFLVAQDDVYRTIELSDYEWIRRADLDDAAMQSIGYELHCEDAKFRQEFGRLLRDYMDYIEEKLDPVSYEDSNPLGETELAIALDSDGIWQQYLDSDWESFRTWYWSKNQLEGHFITGQEVTHLYVGNQFCYHLFPEPGILGRILEKSRMDGRIPVIVLSTMPEFRIPKYRKLLVYLDEWCSRSRSELELVVNDLGIILLEQELTEERVIEGGHFHFTMGVLMNKRTKDARLLRGLARRSSVDAECYQDYLWKRYRVESLSYEACGYEIAYTGRKNILHLPLYQTNTAGFCTTYALCRYGDRSRQVQVRECPRECERHSITYEENVGIISRYNSLFAESRKEIDDLAFLRRITQRQVQRLVVRR